MQNNRIKIITWIAFIIYIAALIHLLFFPNVYGGRYSKFNFNINLIPFKTIKGYVFGSFPFVLILINLAGNLAAFAPFGIFIPQLFKKIRNYRIFIPFMLILISLVEVIQVITHTGVGDIDDLILNFTGAFITSLVCPPPQKLVLG